MDYKSVEFKLHEYLVRIQEMLTLLKVNEEALQVVADSKNLIETKKYNIAVMGEFKRGKSSLINSLLGSKILPADVTPTTATINRITYGTNPSVIIKNKDGSQECIGLHELPDYVTKITPEGEARAEKIEEAVVSFPTVICQNHIDIIDTPGLNDDDKMTEITLELLPDVDAVVVPIHARFPFSETEKKFVYKLISSKNITNIVFVVTFMDQLDEDDYEYDKFMDFIKNRIHNEIFEYLEQKQESQEIIIKAHQILDDLNICGISCTMALKAFVRNDNKMLKKSNFETFSKSLLHTVTAKQVENAVYKTTENIKQLYLDLGIYNASRKTAIENTHNKHNNILLLIKEYKNDVSKVLDSIFADTYEDIQSYILAANKYKNNLIKGYISALSSIKENSHKTILDAIKHSSEKMEQDTERSLYEEAILPIISSYNESITKVIEYKNSIICNLDSDLEITEEINNVDQLKKMKSILENVLNYPTFRININPVYTVDDLSSCNVIEYLIESVDISFNCYIKDLTDAVIEARKICFINVSEDAKIIMQKTEDSIMNLQNHMEDENNAYSRNYSIFSDKFKEIVTDCEQVCKKISGY